MRAYPRNDTNQYSNKVVMDGGCGESVWIDVNGITVHVFQGAGHTIIEAFTKPKAGEMRSLGKLDINDPVKETT
jgi:hypothetical protein